MAAHLDTTFKLYLDIPAKLFSLPRQLLGQIWFRRPIPLLMPAPRPSLSAEAARAAALQAEFNEKKWVWVPDEKDGYLAGWVHQEDDEIAEIVMSSGGEVSSPQLPS